MESQSHKPKRKPPASYFALGGRSPEERIAIEGRQYRFVRLFKHDFFALTALYEAAEAPEPATVTPESAAGTLREQAVLPAQAVLKVQRAYPFFGLPLTWLGKLIAGHEVNIYQRLQGLRGVPRFLGRVGATGFLHEFVPGEELRGNLPLTADFFADLEELFRELHSRHIAYVDSNKRENILYGADGRPWLIDFQISFALKKGQRDNLPMKWLFRRLARSDWYHFYKHKTRLLPEACTAEDFVRAEKRGFLHQVHRLIARPLIQLRRWFLSRYDLANTR